MASKYAKILGHLPALPPADADYQAKVDAVKAEILAEREPIGVETLDAIVSTNLHEITKSVSVLHAALLEAAGGQHHASTFARCYATLRRIENELDEHTKEVRLLLKAYEQLTINQYEVEGTMNLKLDTGASVRVQPEPYAQVIDRDAFHDWCRANGLERSMQLPWMTTNSLTKARLLDGQPEPDGVRAFVNTKVVLMKG